MLIKVVKEIEQTKHNVTCECRPYICRLFSLILSVKYWTYYNVPLNNVFFLLCLETGYWKLRSQETILFEFIMSAWNITAPKKLDCFLLGFSVTVGEFNSDMQYYFTAMQAVLQ